MLSASEGLADFDRNCYHVDNRSLHNNADVPAMHGASEMTYGSGDFTTDPDHSSCPLPENRSAAECSGSTPPLSDLVMEPRVKGDVNDELPGASIRPRHRPDYVSREDDGPTAGSSPPSGGSWRTEDKSSQRTVRPISPLVGASVILRRRWLEEGYASERKDRKERRVQVHSWDSQSLIKYLR
ncbi:hypothetical protein BgiBS90_023204 [Biomphalaria glabrata]|nr:hypothetical protein BgiBS90_023204 [Biomphalaria glabrata]